MSKYIVIGGGILGAAAAYRLARAGVATTLIDRQDSGQATGAAAGIICPWLSQRRNKTWYRLAAAGARYYPELIAELRADGETETGYAAVGALSLHRDPDKLAGLEARAAARKADAPEIGDIERLAAERVRELFPPLAEGNEAVRIGGAARVDGRALRDALVRAAAGRGADIVRGDARLVWEGERVTGVAVGERFYGADAVLVCAGAWARELLLPLGIRMSVGSQKAQIMHLRLAGDPNTGGWPVVIPPTDQYLLAFERGRIVLGATHENGVADFDVRATAGGMQEILDKGLALAPGLADAAFEEMRVGYRPFTPGFLPVAGSVPGWRGLFAGNGLGASGLTVGPFLGSQLAKLAMGRATDIDLADYGIAQALE